MKLIIFGVIFSTLSLASSIDVPIQTETSSPFANENILAKRGTLTPPALALGADQLNQIMYSEIQEQNADLKKVKYHILNGETGLAKVHLHKLAYTQTKLRPVIFRYLGMLAFIDGKFEKSFEYLSTKELQSSPHYAKICTLKVLNQVVLNKKNSLQNEWAKCQLENLTHFNPGNFIWLETLIQLKMNPREGLTKVPFKGIKLSSLNNIQLKIFLKLSIYLNQERLIEPQLIELDLMQLEDPEIRELMGQIFFRMGSLAKSYRYIEDLSSPNAENIKGNIYVLRKKYELAYAQFKLALDKKQNSQNAMERILPLAWILGDWEGGSKIAERVLASPQTQINKMTLIAAFLTQKGDFVRSKEVLETIIARSRKGAEIDVTQLLSFTALVKNDQNIAKKQAGLSCAQFDMINCWLGLQLYQWDSFPLTIRRLDKIAVKKEWEKLSTEELNEPIKETIYVNQVDIEELDDKQIQLIPNAR